MATRKVIYIGGSLTLLGIIMTLMAISGVTVTTSGDITCGKTCTSYFNVTSKYYDICFNVTQLIETSPDVRTELYLKNGTKWQLFNVSSGCLKGSGKKQFKVIGHKKPLQEVKWFSDTLNIPDPIWESASIKQEEICLKNITIKTNVSTIIGYKNITDKNGTTYESPIYKYNIITSKVCTKSEVRTTLGDVIINMSNIKAGMKIETDNTTFDDIYDGNGDGICQAGESCCIITDKVECRDYNAEKIRLMLSKEGIE